VGLPISSPRRRARQCRGRGLCGDDVRQRQGRAAKLCRSRQMVDQGRRRRRSRRRTARLESISEWRGRGAEPDDRKPVGQGNRRTGSSSAQHERARCSAHETLKLWIAPLLSSLASPLVAQGGPKFTYEIFGSIAWAHGFRFEDQSFGDRPNLGVGFGILDRSGWAGEVEYTNTFGLEPKVAPCAIAGVTCVGSAREGVKQATTLSVNASYRFGTARIQPYVIGGAGGFWSSTLTSITVVTGNQATVTERADRDAGIALNIGGGVRVPLTEALTLRAEFRFYDAGIRSRANLAMIRASIGLGYRW